MSSADRLSAAAIRARLAATQPPEDPTAVVMPPGSERWPHDFREALTHSLVPAGVLVPVIERHDELTVLLTRRAAELRHHAGQISFPGGRMEAADADIEETALRETHEEVGIAPQAVSVAGYLEPMPTVTGYAITAVVGLVEPPQAIVVDPSEVELAFEVPLGFLLDDANAIPSSREIHGRRIPIVEYRYHGHRIWGATAHILLNLRSKLF